jgi:hypothetical protein
MQQKMNEKIQTFLILLIISLILLFCFSWLGIYMIKRGNATTTYQKVFSISDNQIRSFLPPDPTSGNVLPIPIVLFSANLSNNLPFVDGIMELTVFVQSADQLNKIALNSTSHFVAIRSGTMCNGIVEDLNPQLNNLSQSPPTTTPGITPMDSSQVAFIYNSNEAMMNVNPQFTLTLNGIIDTQPWNGVVYCNITNLSPAKIM